LELEGNGREVPFAQGDWSRTVGRFTAPYPIRIDLESSDDAGELLDCVADALAQVPRKGVGHGVLRYLGRPELSQAMSKRGTPQVVWNYFGQLDRALPAKAPLRLVTEPIGIVHSPRPHRLEVGANIYQGRLNVTFQFSRSCYEPTTIESLANQFLSSLRDLIEYSKAEIDNILDQVELDEV
jgi:non-ribosomal peptide synthase protein (TIGR01720 family)